MWLLIVSLLASVYCSSLKGAVTKDASSFLKRGFPLGKVVQDGIVTPMAFVSVPAVLVGYSYTGSSCATATMTQMAGLALGQCMPNVDGTSTKRQYDNSTANIVIVQTSQYAGTACAGTATSAVSHTYTMTCAANAVTDDVFNDDGYSDFWTFAVSTDLAGAATGADYVQFTYTTSAGCPASYDSFIAVNFNVCLGSYKLTSCFTTLLLIALVL